MEADEQIDYARMRRRASTALFTGVIALVSSLVIVGGLIGIVAIVIGRRASRQIQTHGGTGAGMARGGVILGYAAILAAIVALIVYVSAARLNRLKPRPVLHDAPPATQFHR